MKFTRAVGIGLAFGLLATGAVAQKRQKVEATDIIREMLYAQYKDLFQSAGTPTADTQKDYVYPWANAVAPTGAALSEALDSLMGRFTCTKGADELLLKSKFPANVDIDRGCFSMRVANVLLKNEKGLAVRVDTSINFVQFGSEFSSSFQTDSSGNTTSQSISRITVGRSIGLKDKPKKIGGTITVACSLAAGYDYVKLTSMDVGKEIRLGEVTLRLLSVNGPTAVVKVISGSNDFSYKVANSNNEPYMGMSAKLNFAQQDYDFLSQPNALDKATFDAYYLSNKDRMLSKDAVRDVVVIKGAGPIGNLYLYKPASRVTRRAEVVVNL
ncbi:hypothetical protein [uncultured Acetobacteroides sp.]|uniref:hypothetical protein n=1 Tax=uncultured Acetobacteroides sp. TaxID=1760811 RepID=UPI0029F4B3A9|nr:hypothetical protein [uncultured Acetobacteroides sp.]